MSKQSCPVGRGERGARCGVWGAAGLLASPSGLLSLGLQSHFLSKSGEGVLASGGAQVSEPPVPLLRLHSAPQSPCSERRASLHSRQTTRWHRDRCLHVTPPPRRAHGLRRQLVCCRGRLKPPGETLRQRSYILLRAVLVLSSLICSNSSSGSGH